jgi:hypothetical protein
VILSNCLTFNFQQPVWRRLKAKAFLANIVVVLLFSLGLASIVSAFAGPVLLAFGLNSSFAGFLPFLATVGLVQVVFMWFLIWAPLERRIIHKRLAAQGLSSAQLQSAFLVGLSDPTSSSFRKFGGIEDDLGALWIGQDQLVYYGDVERFSITRDQLTQIERRADAGSATILSGLAHIILHVRLTDGSERQIRLHIEGVSTQGKKRKVMDELADAIARWHSTAAPASIA